LSSGPEEAVLVDVVLREMINSIPYIRTLKVLNISSEFVLTRFGQNSPV
jgi:hypothetical protein